VPQESGDHTLCRASRSCMKGSFVQRSGRRDRRQYTRFQKYGHKVGEWMIRQSHQIEDLRIGLCRKSIDRTIVLTSEAAASP
jgi:hypothetical protein